MSKLLVRPKTDHAKKLATEQKKKNRLTSIKNEMESGRLTSFDQIFAIMSETSVSGEMKISFYAFKKKVLDPGEFTLNEVMRLALLFGVKYDTMAEWLRDRIKANSKSKVFRE